MFSFRILSLFLIWLTCCMLSVSAEFYQQLQDLNLGETWSAVNVPVLVLHGTTDTIMSHADSVEIANIVNRTHPGYAPFTNIPGTDHLLTIHGKLADSAVPKMLQWMNTQLQQN